MVAMHENHSGKGRIWDKKRVLYHWGKNHNQLDAKVGRLQLRNKESIRNRNSDLPSQQAADEVMSSPVLDASEQGWMSCRRKCTTQIE